MKNMKIRNVKIKKTPKLSVEFETEKLSVIVKFIPVYKCAGRTFVGYKPVSEQYYK